MSHWMDLAITASAIGAVEGAKVMARRRKPAKPAAPAPAGPGCWVWLNDTFPLCSFSENKPTASAIHVTDVGEAYARLHYMGKRLQITKLPNDVVKELITTGFTSCTRSDFEPSLA